MSSWSLIGIDHINCVIQNSIPREGREKCKWWDLKEMQKNFFKRNAISKRILSKMESPLGIEFRRTKSPKIFF